MTCIWESNNGSVWVLKSVEYWKEFICYHYKENCDFNFIFIFLFEPHKAGNTLRFLKIKI